jgi:hypothetical protein
VLACIMLRHRRTPVVPICHHLLLLLCCRPLSMKTALLFILGLLVIQTAALAAPSVPRRLATGGSALNGSAAAVPACPDPCQ